MAISDLLVLTLTVGASLACVTPMLRDFLALPDDELRIPRWRGVVPEITDYTTIGIALFGLLVLARQKIRNSTFTLAPGHWIFMAIGPYFMLFLTSWVLKELLPDAWIGNHQDAIFAMIIAPSVPVALFGARKCELRWRVCLLLVGAWLSIVFAWCLLEAIKRPAYRWELIVCGANVFLLAFGSACVAVSIDLARGVRRDWLHYFAVAMLATYAASVVSHWGDMLANWWSDLFVHVIR